MLHNMSMVFTICTSSLSVVNVSGCAEDNVSHMMDKSGDLPADDFDYFINKSVQFI